MPKLLVVYNTCGLSGRENTSHYLHSLNTILNQNFITYDVVVSDCLSSQKTRQILTNNLQSKVYFNFIDEKLPVNNTFNCSVQKTIALNGHYDGYIYVDSGVDFGDDKLVLQKMYDLYNSGPYSMVVARTKTDTGFHAWLGWGRDENDYLGHREALNDNHYKIPLGKAVNLHAQLFSDEMLVEYGNLMPDIFAGHCSESVLSFLAAALNTKWVIHKDIELEHKTALDMASVGFSPSEWQSSGRPTWDHLIIEESILDIIGRGQKYGMGYEELRGIVNHDPTKFDENDFALDSSLKHYIKNNLFLQTSELDYSTVNSTWINK